MANTYTCSHCGKVGKSFISMAKGICPKNRGAGHQIPVFGDM